MPFEITPFMIYLMRVGSENPNASALSVPASPAS